jgi:hypothetical protein
LGGKLDKQLFVLLNPKATALASAPHTLEHSNRRHTAGKENI